MRLVNGVSTRFRSQVNKLADVFHADIPQQRAGQQSGFGQDLESVADAEDESAFFGEIAQSRS